MPTRRTFIRSSAALVAAGMVSPFSAAQRSGNQQVCIGLVCTPEGLPLSFEVFAGNRADVSTVEEIVRAMEEKYGAAERIWVMVRGMVSAANLDFLRQRKARYLVGTPKSWLRAHARPCWIKPTGRRCRPGWKSGWSPTRTEPPASATSWVAAARGPRRNAPCSSDKASG